MACSWFHWHYEWYSTLSVAAEKRRLRRITAYAGVTNRNETEIVACIAVLRSATAHLSGVDAEKRPESFGVAVHP